MKHPFEYVPALLVLAAPAWADPCVSNTFDRPFPNAVAVESFVADVPSAQFPGFWQSGILDGRTYRLFSNGEGEVTSGSGDQTWSVKVACNAAQQDCTVTTQGNAPEDAMNVANKLGQCLLGRDPADPEPTPVVAEETPTTPATESVATEEAVEPVKEPQAPATPIACGTDAVDEASEVATMQRLLKLLGEDPGPVDGFLGPTTFVAMDAFVEDSNWDTSIPELINLLDTLHCERVQ